jgi:hypothetical protein
LNTKEKKQKEMLKAIRPEITTESKMTKLSSGKAA